MPVVPPPPVVMRVGNAHAGEAVESRQGLEGTTRRPQVAFEVVLGAKGEGRVEVGGTAMSNHTCSGKRGGCPD